MRRFGQAVPVDQLHSVFGDEAWNFDAEQNLICSLYGTCHTQPITNCYNQQR